MNKLILSAFADEYADNLKEQCEALNKFGIENIEIRSTITESKFRRLVRRSAKSI